MTDTSYLYEYFLAKSQDEETPEDSGQEKDEEE